MEHWSQKLWLWIMIFGYLIWGALPAAAPAQDAVQADFDRAMAVYNQRQWAEGQAAFEAFIASHPDAGDKIREAEFTIAKCLFNQRLLDAFTTRTLSLFQRYPGAPPQLIEDLQFNLAMVPFWKKSADECKQSVARYVEQYPSAAPDRLEQLYFNLGMLLMEKERNDEALEQFAKAAALDLKPSVLSVIKMERSQALWGKAKEYWKAGQQDRVLETRAQSLALAREAREEMMKQIPAEQDVEQRFRMIETVFTSLCYGNEPDYDELAVKARLIAEMFPLVSGAPPSREWVNAKIWLGWACLQMNKQDLDGAAAAYDAVLGSGYTAIGSEGNCPMIAAIQRMKIAAMREEWAVARSIVRHVKADLPDTIVKRNFLSSFNWLLDNAP